MAVITMTLPDAALPRVVTAICARFGYRDTLPDGSANPETRGQFAMRMMREQLKNWVKEYEIATARDNAAAAAAAAAAADIDQSVTIT